MTNEPYVITINHQLGCGGAYIGQKLSELLSHLAVSEADIENREERVASFWQTFSRLELFSDPLTAATAEYFPSDRELFDLESDYIGRITKESSAIILGRGGRSILRDYPRQLSVFVEADIKDRVKRVSELYHLSENEAKRTIERNDRERNAYMKSFTKPEWLDVRTYDLSINTSGVGVDHAASVIKECAEYKLGV
jgi:cytidylate kinase